MICNKFCKELNVTGDEFQEVVTKLVEEKKGQEREVEGSWEIGVVGSATAEKNDKKGGKEEKGEAGNDGGEKMEQAKPPRKPPTPSANYDTKRIEKIPTMVARHLIKQGKKKQKNIEVNTKTRLKIIGDFASNEGGEVDLEISGESDKRINAAMVFVIALRKAYGKNPERFNPDMIRQQRDGEEGGERQKKKQRKFY